MSGKRYKDWTNRRVCLIAVVFLAVLSIAGGICSKRRHYPYYGTKTLYRNVAGSLDSDQASLETGCRPVFLYVLFRHGARLPGSKILRRFDELQQVIRSLNETGRAKLCGRKLEKLRQWREWTDEWDQKNLSTYGETEMRELAIRLQNFFPTLLNTSQSTHRYTSTASERTIQSLKSFIAGLGNRSIAHVAEHEYDVTEDAVDHMKSDNCPRFVREIENNETTLREYNNFIKGRTMTRIARRIARRLGVTRISTELVWVVYEEGCAKQQFAQGHTNPWCDIFTRVELQALEFAMDLENHPETSYPNPIAHQLSCSLAKEIVNSVHAAKWGNSTYDVIIRSAHSSNILRLATNMRLYRRMLRCRPLLVKCPTYKIPSVINPIVPQERSPLTADRPSFTRRHFRSSRMAPSAANLLFALYRCPGGHHVRVYWNEKLLTSYPACRTGRGTENMILIMYNPRMEKHMGFITRVRAGHIAVC